MIYHKLPNKPEEASLFSGQSSVDANNGAVNLASTVLSFARCRGIMVSNQANLFTPIAQDNVAGRRFYRRANENNVPFPYVRLKREASNQETFNIFTAIIG